MPSQQKTISCIALDDDELFLMKLTSFLEEIPEIALIETFCNHIKGATAIVNQLPDLVITDLEMPYMDGYNLLDWILPMLSEMKKKPRIVVISGNDEIMQHDHLDIVTHIQKGNLNSAKDLQEQLGSLF